MYEVRFVNGLYWVFLGDEPVTKGYKDQSIAQDFCTVLNTARSTSTTA